MSHIYGHVDNTNTNPPDWDNYYMMAKKLSTEERQQAIDSIGMDQPFGIVTVAAKKDDNDKTIRQLPYKNEDRITLPKWNGNGDNIAFHVYLTKFDEDKKKYRAYASDVVPLQYHKDAETEAVPLLVKATGENAETLEEFNPDDIERIALKNFDNKPHLRKVLLQTASYMRSPSYKVLYYDDKDGSLLKEPARLKNIATKVVFKEKQVSV